MPADRIHLVRHGEVFNPEGVLYGRIPGYHLSDAGRDMAKAAADHLVADGRTVTRLVCSPLQRTQESAEPWAQAYKLVPVIDERVIEPTNVFEGTQMRKALRNPLNWWHLRRPSLPSWGEPFQSMATRMLAAMDDAWDSVHGGDVVIVSHQAPIWVAHLAVAGEKLAHDPRSRRCALSSVTSFERRGTTWREVAYAEPAATDSAVDVGAV